MGRDAHERDNYESPDKALDEVSAGIGGSEAGAQFVKTGSVHCYTPFCANEGPFVRARIRMTGPFVRARIIEQKYYIGNRRSRSDTGRPEVSSEELAQAARKGGGWDGSSPLWNWLAGAGADTELGSDGGSGKKHNAGDVPDCGDGTEADGRNATEECNRPARKRRRSRAHDCGEDGSGRPV